MTPLTHREIEELLGAFALDAVDADEREAVEAHLAGCPRCRAEVASFRETAALLANEGAPAPEGVWSRISETLDESPPDLDLGPVVPLRRRDGGRRSISVRVAAAVAAVAAVVMAFLAVRVADQGQRLDEVNRALSQEGVRRAAFAALAEPDAEQLWLKSPDGKVAVRLARLPNGSGFVVADRLEPLAEDRTYQLWALRRDANISLGVLGNHPDVASFQMVGPVLGYAITNEHAPGVTSTEESPVVLGFTERSGA